MENQLYIYLIVVNLITFFLYGADKSKARRHAWRIPEKVLLGAAVIGGSLGALVGMRFFHHKTRKPLFYIGVPMIIIAQIALALWCGYTGTIL